MPKLKCKVEQCIYNYDWLCGKNYIDVDKTAFLTNNLLKINKPISLKNNTNQHAAKLYIIHFKLNLFALTS